MKSSRHLNENPVFGVVRSIIIGSVAGAALCAALLGVFALAFVSSGYIPQGLISPLVIGISAISAFVSGFVTAKISKRRGLAFGVLAGLFLFAMFVFSGMIAFKEAISASCLLRMLVMALSGAIGGFLAVNKKSKIK
jgi:putative membrane protein (TIGR04086 family)